MNLVYEPIIYFIKLFLILFYFCVFDFNIQEFLKFAIIIIFIFQTCFFIIDLAIVCAQYLICVSTAILQKNLCNVTSKIVVAQNAVSVTINVSILIISITLLFRLHLTLGRKLQLIALFCARLYANQVIGQWPGLYVNNPVMDYWAIDQVI